LPSPNDPILSLARRIMLIRVTAAVALTGAAAWALWPSTVEQDAASRQRSLPMPTAPAQPGDASPPPIAPPLDPNVFTARLWNPPPEPPPAEPDTPPAQPTKPDLMLIAIVHGDGVLRAALYDQTAHKLLVLASGEMVRQYTVADISSERIILVDDTWTHELRLRSPRQDSPSDGPLARLLKASSPGEGASP
jgi:hypothetical protein